MNNPDVEIRFAEARRRDLMREATIQRLMHDAQTDAPRLQRRLLLLLSDLMITSGNRLKGYATPPPRATWGEWVDPPLELLPKR